MDIAKWLREARKAAHLNQENAAALLDQTKGNWSAWENGRHNPSIHQLARISVLLKYPLPEELAGNTTTKSDENVTKGTDVGGFLRLVSPQTEYAGQVAYSSRVPVTATARLRSDGCYEETAAMGGVDGFVLLQTTDGLAHALRVRGDQMAPAIRDGWYVVVSPGSQPAVGEYVTVKLRDGSQMVRELLYQRPDSIAVMEVNGQVRQTILAEDIDNIHAIAAVIAPSQWRPT